MRQSLKILVYGAAFISGCLVVYGLDSAESRLLAVIGICVVTVMLGRELLAPEIGAAEDTGNSFQQPSIQASYCSDAQLVRFRQGRAVKGHEDI